MIAAGEIKVYARVHGDPAALTFGRPQARGPMKAQTTIFAPHGRP
jgi:hypothetical protein